MTGAQGPNDQHSVRRRLWRFVRDAGRNGVAAGRVVNHFGMLDADQTRELFAWIDRIHGGLCLLDYLPGAPA